MSVALLKNRLHVFTLVICTVLLIPEMLYISITQGGASQHHALPVRMLPATVSVKENTSDIPSRPHSMSDSRPGFTFGLQIWEQMAESATNVLNLQCWAASVNLKVLEPSFQDSFGDGENVFRFIPNSTKQFRHLIDLEHWNEFSETHHYTPLSSMETFLETAPQNTIYVEIRYHTKLCPERLTVTLTNHDEFHTTDRFGPWFASKLLKGPYWFLHSHGFRVVRTVCISLLQDGRLRTQKEFDDLIFGNLARQENFNVIFAEWRAIHNESGSDGKLKIVNPRRWNHRILIRDSLCHRNLKELAANYHSSPKNTDKSDINALRKSELGLIPSDHVLKNTAEYRAKHMGNRPYIAIMMRLEIMKGIHNKQLYNSCLNRIVNLWRYATKTYHINQTYITSDLGKYGSLTWQPSQVTEQLQQDIIKAVGLPPSFPNARDKSLESITQSTGRVSIAWTQSIVAAQAQCMIVIGGGGYQTLVLHNHMAMYEGNECFAALSETCQLQDKLGFQ